jgi:hypothetical protein
MIINLKVAKALGLDLPESVLARADGMSPEMARRDSLRGAAT